MRDGRVNVLPESSGTTMANGGQSAGAYSGGIRTAGNCELASGASHVAKSSVATPHLLDALSESERTVAQLQNALDDRLEALDACEQAEHDRDGYRMALERERAEHRDTRRALELVEKALAKAGLARGEVPQNISLDTALPTTAWFRVSMLMAQRDDAREELADCRRILGAAECESLSDACRRVLGESEAVDERARAGEAEIERLRAELRDYARELLPTLMSEISEDCWCAGWLHGTEYALWKMVEHGAGKWGQGEVTQARVDRLRRLSELAGGWFAWRDGDGPEFVPMERWVAEFAKKESKQ